MSFLDVNRLALLRKLEEAVQPECQRLRDPKNYSKSAIEKAELIEEALLRLKSAVQYMEFQENSSMVLEKSDVARVARLKQQDVEMTPLSTIDEMIRAKISVYVADPFRGQFQRGYSVQDALNYGRKNYLNCTSYAFGPLWGQSESLKRVLARIQEGSG